MTTLERVLDHFGDAYIDMPSIPVTGPVHEDTEILRAYLGAKTYGHAPGQIVAVVRHADRVFKIRFHVWRAHQSPSEANRLTEIEELVTRTETIAGEPFEYLDAVPTDFGHKAFWLRTPVSDLDADAVALRAVAARLKSYSVTHQWCRKFRTTGHA